MNYEDHPIAAIFPILPKAEIAKLAEDIKANGLEDEIELFEGKILDGRNRYRACVLEDLPVKTKTFNGTVTQAINHVWSKNFHRRHLNPSQAAIADAKRQKVTQVYAPIAEAAKERKAATQAKPGEKVGQHKVTQRIESPLDRNDRSTDAVRARAAGTNRTYIHLADKLVEDRPDIAEKIESGELTVPKAKRMLDQEQKKAALQDAQTKISEEKRKSLDAVFRAYPCRMEELFHTGKVRADMPVITDPPYPEKYLPLYGILAECCAKAKVPLVAVMCGQSYLPDIMALMTPHLKYLWTMAYLTPGGQAVQQWQAKVNTFWKPILIFGKAPAWFGDVVASDVNDNDKRFHGWGQSESGMAKLVDCLTKPGDWVCDPFMGGGTTAVVALKLGRKFIGCDTDSECVLKCRQRVEGMDL